MTDAVILWVDGAEPTHQRKRARYADEAHGSARKSNAPTRFADRNEIAYCIGAIRRFAPWIETIHLITDAQRPRWLTRKNARDLGVVVVDHHAVFGDHNALLPTFNSRSIENFLHRVPGLSARFLYFNDDFFLVAPTHEKDYFDAGLPVLRGRVAPLGERFASEVMDEVGRVAARAIPRVYRDGFVGPAAETERLSARQRHRFFLAHAPIPIDRDSFADTMERFGGHENARFRFRSPQQFRPNALWASLAIADGTAMAGPADWEYIDPTKHFRPVVAHRLARCRANAVKSLCVQSLDQAPARRFEPIVDFLERHIGSVAPA